MTALETERLRIVALTPEQFGMLLDAPERLGRSLGFVPGEPPDGHTLEAMRGLYAEARKRRDAFPWMASWLIILKAERAAVGSACFMAPPDERGVVDVGYGLYARFRGRGFMTEALGALARWALEQPHVREVAAETERDNAASRSVLERCGFELCREEAESLFWRLDLKSPRKQEGPFFL